MALTRRIGLGIVLSVDTANSGNASNFQTLGYIVDGLKDSEAKATVIDCAIITDTYVPKGKGQVTAGDRSMMIAYDPNDGSNTSTSYKLASMLTTTGAPGGEANFKIFYPAVGSGNNASEYFLGWVTGYSVERQKDKFLTAQVTIAVSGSPGYNGV